MMRCHHEVTLGCIWGHIGITLGSHCVGSRLDHFGITLGSLLGHCGSVLGSFCGVFRLPCAMVSLDQLFRSRIPSGVKVYAEITLFKSEIRFRIDFSSLFDRFGLPSWVQVGSKIGYLGSQGGSKRGQKGVSKRVPKKASKMNPK